MLVRSALALALAATVACAAAMMPAPVQAAAKPATLSVLYPATAGSHFDRTYYAKSHGALVRKQWMPLGMTGMTVAYGAAGLGGAASPYHVITTITFRSRAALDRAVTGPASKPVFADIPKFTDVAPVAMIGD